jgi:PAS domain S-box-containing protein
MSEKPTYEELEKRIQELERAESKHTQDEEALRVSEDRFRGIVNSMADWIWEVASDGRYTYCSKRVEKVLGYSPNEMIGKTPFDFMSPDKVQRNRNAFRKIVVEKSSIKKMENWNIRKDGRLVCLLTTGEPILSEDGDLLGYRGVDTDITERKRAEKALQESEDRYRGVVEDTPFLICRFLPRGEITFVNKAYCEYFSKTFEESIGSTFLMLIPEADRQAVTSSISSLTVESPTQSIKHRVIAPNGDICWQRWTNRAMFDSEGKAITYQSIGEDITESKQAEEKFKKSRERYRTIMDSMKEPLYIGSKEFIVEYMNASMVKRIGHDATGEKCFKAILGFDKQCSWCNTEAIKKGEVYSLSIVSPKDNHSFDISSCPIINDDGSVSMLNVFRNVTKIKNMEQQLHQAQKMEAIGILAGGIAHDFNNILFPIVGYTQMLIEDVPEDSPLRNSLDEIYAGTMRAKNLVQQILTFSRQENGELKPMKIQPIIKEALKLIRSSIPTTIEIKQNIKTDCRAIVADSTQIHQILMNLTTNAYHAMEKSGGKLKVSLGEVELGKFDLIYADMKPGTYACLTVSDTGVGMDRNVTTKIFNPFFTTKEKGKGTGMGLSVVHGIVKKAGGYIHVYSEPGKGTEFHVYLPVIKNSAEKYQTQTKKIIQGGTEQILLVDDENAILTMEKQMLERLGYHVTTRVNSIEALECFRASSDKFDLVITDMAMPGMSGDKLSAELIKIRPDIPILLCTGFSETLSEEDAAYIGIKGFLMKPILMKDLSQKIYEMINKKDIGMLAN